jgi:hypothetical protein
MRTGVHAFAAILREIGGESGFLAPSGGGSNDVVDFHVEAAGDIDGPCRCRLAVGEGDDVAS